jgi:ABC-2 type transport system ATP-binding protein
MSVAVPIVAVAKLCKFYGAFAALNECSLTIPEGSVFGLLGPNGAGKTTMIRCLLGYLKPTSGQASIDGVDCLKDSLQVRQRVSYLPAESKMFRLMRGTDCLDFFTSIHPRGNKSRALEIAKRLELDLRRRVAFMSTGMRQKLAISCVMSCQSRLMILDEPTANLDPTVRGEVLQLVREAKNRGTTVAFCSHVLDEIEEVCDQAAILKRGRVEKTIDISQLSYVHRIVASSGDETAKQIQQRQLQDRLLVLEHANGKIVMEAHGPLEDHLGWLATADLCAIQISRVGLRSAYDEVHSKDSGLAN